MTPQNIPKWQLLADELREKITNGTYAPGAILPRQIDLAAERGWSDNTVRRAYSALQAEGLVTPTPRLGTVVNQAPQLTGKDRAKAVRATGRIYPEGEYARIVSAELVPAPESVASVLGIDAGAPAIKRVRITYGPDDAPRSASTSWYDGSFAEAAPDLLVPERIRAGSWRYLEQQAGITASKGRDVITARLATEDDAELLSVQLPAAIKESTTVLRTTDGSVVEYGVSIAASGRASSYDYDLPS
ncbi:GntR family transcriptional regulator [Streptomyces sp. NPDC055912]|uniref:GntR family transcriptional regulator n=1 Tax=Streptomyces sp. NPDC055912 TaxID=3345660 RepID=UPI0035E21100